MHMAETGASQSRNCVEHAALSDVGFRRSNNQDSMVSVLAASEEQWRLRGHLFVVADGMGGHAAGELASKLAVDTIPLSFQKQRDKPTAEAMRAAVEEANHVINNRGRANPDFQGMGTTSSCLLITPAGAMVAHVGDSRIYRLHGTAFEQLTADHSYVWELTQGGKKPLPVGEGVIPRNIITRSLGPNPAVEVDLEGPFAVEQGDRFLLCSDGLCGQLSDEEMGAVLYALPPKEAVEALVHLANLRGGPDNITVIIVEALTRLHADEHDLFNHVAGSSDAKVHAAVWATLAGTVLAAIGTAIVRPLWGAIAGGVGLLVTLLVYLLSRPRDSASRHAGGQRGSGPYCRYDAAPQEATVKAIAQIHEQLRSAAIEQDRVVDWNRLDGLERSAAAARDNHDYTSSVRDYCRAMTFLMRQIKKQPAK